MVFHLHGACSVQGWPWVSPNGPRQMRLIAHGGQIPTRNLAEEQQRGEGFSVHRGCCSTLHHMALSCFVWVSQNAMVYYHFIILSFTILSYHNFIILSSYHSIILSSYHSIILSSYHIIILSYHNLVVSS